MNKNSYHTPTVQVVQLNIRHHLLDLSVTSVTMGDDLHTLEMGGETKEADSRRHTLWDDGSD